MECSQRRGDAVKKKKKKIKMTVICLGRQQKDVRFSSPDQINPLFSEFQEEVWQWMFVTPVKMNREHGLSAKKDILPSTILQNIKELSICCSDYCLFIYLVLTLFGTNYLDQTWALFSPRTTFGPFAIPIRHAWGLNTTLLLRVHSHWCCLGHVKLTLVRFHGYYISFGETVKRIKAANPGPPITLHLKWTKSRKGNTGQMYMQHDS